MYCSQCGHSNPDGAAFCTDCGNALTQDTKTTAQPPVDSGVQSNAANQQTASFSMPPTQEGFAPQPPYPPQEAYKQPPYPPQGAYTPTPYPPQGEYSQPPYPPMPYPLKKKRTGLIIGLSIGLFVIAAAVVALFVWPGVLVPKAPDVSGFWLSEDRGEALEFKDNDSVRVYTTYDELKGQYDYDVSKGMGTIKVEDEEYAFAMTKEGIKVDGMGVYEKAEDDFDVDGFIDDMSAAVNVTAEPPASVETSAAPTKEPSVMVSSDPAQGPDITGLWYETTGYGGTIEFFADGTYKETLMNMPFSGTYSYDAASSSWTLAEETTGTTYTVTLSDSYLILDTLQYTRDYVEQVDWTTAQDAA